MAAPPRSNFKLPLDTSRVLGDWSTSPAYKARGGSGWESPLNEARLCHCHPETGSIDSSQVHSNKAAGKNSPRGVSFLLLYDAYAYVAGLQWKQLAPGEAGNFTRAAPDEQTFPLKETIYRYF